MLLSDSELSLVSGEIPSVDFVFIVGDIEAVMFEALC